MGKSLTQITFDFSALTEENTSSAPEQTPVTINNPTVAKEEYRLVAPQQIEQKEEEPVKEKEDKPISTRGRRSLKEFGVRADLIDIPPDEILFQKQYYAIGEVAGMFKENQSLIRYWETEFDILQPRKNRKGDRFFRPVDIKNLVLIHDLLRRRKFTIEGAKEYLKKNKKAEEKFAAIQSLEKVKAFLLELKASL